MTPSSHIIIGPLDGAPTPPLEVEARFGSDDPDPMNVRIEFEDTGIDGVRLVVTVSSNERHDPYEVRHV